MPRYCFYCGRELAKNVKCHCKTAGYTGENSDRSSQRPNSAGSERANSGASQTSYNSKESGRNRAEQRRNRFGGFSFNRYKLINTWRQACYQFHALIFRPLDCGSLAVNSSRSVPFLVMILNTLVIFASMNLFVRHTTLGKFLQYSLFNQAPSDALFSLPSFITLLYIVHWPLKIVLTFFFLRIIKYHGITWLRCYRTTLPGLLYQMMFFILSWFLIYGSGFLAVGILWLSMAVSLLANVITISGEFGLERNRSIMFNILLYLVMASLLAGCANILFNNVALFHIENGIIF